MKSGDVHIKELEYFDALVPSVLARGNLPASLQIEPADVFVIAMPTPLQDNHAPNTRPWVKAATYVMTCLSRLNWKSTKPSQLKTPPARSFDATGSHGCGATIELGGDQPLETGVWLQ
ncbi:MAG: hypothetical protein EON93_00295 [Burkholderiales bacterium]|nr:MAG: hypothetical protein EON93_00295 [Burkholderiales bacterium]